MSPAWVHDFAATDKYAVIIEHPLYMQLGSLLLNTPATHIFSKSAAHLHSHDPGPATPYTSHAWLGALMPVIAHIIRMCDICVLFWFILACVKNLTDPLSCC
jgi:hypothetical protein